MGSVAEISRIYDWLFIGSVAGATPKKAQEYNFSWIIDASKTGLNDVAKDKFPSNVQFMELDVEDTEESDIAQYFDEVSDLIQQEKERGGKVLVYCAAGVSRSAALAIAYCVKHEDMSLRNAYLYVKKARRRVSPNYGFWRQLMDFEEVTRNCERTVKMVTPVKRTLPDVYLDEWKEGI